MPAHPRSPSFQDHLAIVSRSKKAIPTIQPMTGAVQQKGNPVYRQNHHPSQDGLYSGRMCLGLTLQKGNLYKPRLVHLSHQAKAKSNSLSDLGQKKGLCIGVITERGCLSVKPYLARLRHVRQTVKGSKYCLECKISFSYRRNQIPSSECHFGVSSTCLFCQLTFALCPSGTS